MDVLLGISVWKGCHEALSNVFTCTPIVRLSLQMAVYRRNGSPWCATTTFSHSFSLSLPCVIASSVLFLFLCYPISFVPSAGIKLSLDEVAFIEDPERVIPVVINYAIPVEFPFSKFMPTCSLLSFFSFLAQTGCKGLLVAAMLSAAMCTCSYLFSLSLSFSVSLTFPRSVF